MDEGVFSGEYDRTVDGAGRVALPSTFRDLLGERCYATKDPQGCITLRTAARYAEEALRLETREASGDAPKGTGRALSTRTVIVSVDKQGRVTLDEANRAFAAIESGAQAMVIGHNRGIEIWQPKRWAIVRAEDSHIEPDRVWPLGVDE